MNRIQKLEESVRQQYDTQNPSRTDWADWLGAHHVFVVADHASELAKRFNANPELARAAALLHDVADTVMSRFDEAHEQTSLKLAAITLEECGYQSEEIELIVNDAIKYHSCHDGKVPVSLEGKILATADSMAHLQSDFYIYATWARAKDNSLEDIKSWVLKKIDRDFYDKILFSEVKQELEQSYRILKQLFALY